MLGVAVNPKLWPADDVLKEIAEEIGQGHTFHPTNVGVFFGPEGKEVPDPYFGGEGPPRRGCDHCGGCMVGCRNNGKNMLTKNYLHLAKKSGATLMWFGGKAQSQLFHGLLRGLAGARVPSVLGICAGK